MSYKLHKAVLKLGYSGFYTVMGRMKYIKELAHSQWFSSNQLKELQLEKLRRLLRHVRQQVPYYRKLLEGMCLDDSFGFEEFKQIPILTKKDVQENSASLQAEDVEGKENHTGGSTGEPLTFYQCENYWHHNFADKIRTYQMCGYEVGDKAAFLWGSDYDSRAHKGFLHRLWDRVAMNLIWINVFDVDEEGLYQHALELAKFKPKIIVGYASSLLMFANLVRERGITGIEPVGTQSSAEILTPEMRAVIEATFECKVFDRYGCREVGNIAHECSEHNGLHILAENNYVEFLDGGGAPVEAGEPGRIIVTNLNNYVMPFIRYEVGDIGVPSSEECPCGRGLPLMEVVKGRTSDVIQSPGGRLLHGEFFTHLFYGIKGVSRFQVVQESLEDLTVRVVPTSEFERSETLSLLEAMIQRHGDPGFRIRFELSSCIPPSESGKYRFTISKVPLSLTEKTASAKKGSGGSG